MSALFAHSLAQSNHVVEMNTLNFASKDELSWLQELAAFEGNYDQLTPTQCFENRVKAHQLLSTHTPIAPKYARVLFEFSFVAFDWYLQINITPFLTKRTSYDHCRLAYAQWKHGNWHNALQALEKMMWDSPDNNEYYHLYQYLLKLSVNFPQAQYCSGSANIALNLVPLAEHHGDEFLSQYWHPDIANLCCLPHFEGNEHWCHWLAYQQAIPNQTTYAIEHQEWGFIGCVCLLVHQGMGFLYYWISKNFQGQGFAVQAANIALDHARERDGLSHCFAKVFEENEGSKKVLKKLSFQRLPVNACEPYQNEELYYWGEQISPEQQCEKLHYLFDAMNTVTRVATPILNFR